MSDDRQVEMGLARLRDVLDAYGGDPARWPVTDRHLHARLIADAGSPAMSAAGPATRSAELTRALAEARSLDALLDDAKATEAPRNSALADRIVAAAISERAGSVAERAHDERVVPLRRQAQREAPRDRPVSDPSSAIARSIQPSNADGQGVPTASISERGDDASRPKGAVAPFVRRQKAAGIASTRTGEASSGRVDPLSRRRGANVAAVLAASLLLGVYFGGQVTRLTVVQDVASAVGLTKDADAPQIVAFDEAVSEDIL